MGGDSFRINNVRLPDSFAALSLVVRSGVVSAIGGDHRGEHEAGADLTRYDAAGALLLPGFVDAHVHLDKAMLIGRCPVCEGSLAEAVRQTATCKAAFTVDDVHARASEVLDLAFRAGTRAMRTFVEVDPRAGLRGFEAIMRLKREWSHLLELQVCAFAQEGLTQEPATLGLLAEALAGGATVVGGCPYTDPEPERHVELIFDLAQRFDVDADFHADFDLDPKYSILPKIVAETVSRAWRGRVVVGHATKFAAFAPETRKIVAGAMRDAGVGLVALPSTDAYIIGDRRDPLRPRGMAPAAMLAEAGVRVAIATNNVQNFFTPYGDASLIRMAQFAANLEHLASDADLGLAHAMISDVPARMIGSASPALAVGRAADFILVQATSAADAIRRIAPVTAVVRSGRMRLWAPIQPILREV